jgi:predicted RND superfamily exporter protein
LSDFFDKYNKIQDKRQTIIHVMNELFTPMLITTLTTIAGFASLALTPIPPVQTFGIFIAIGVFLAWLWSITFIPAFIVTIPDEKLAGFINNNNNNPKTFMGHLLVKAGNFTYNHALIVVLISMSTIGIAAYGINKINVNDNPIKWFNAEHPIRVADRVLNEHFGGTYMAYLALEVDTTKTTHINFKPAMLNRLHRAEKNASQLKLTHAKEIFAQVNSKIDNHIGPQKLLSTQLLKLLDKGFETSADDELDTWDQVQLFIDSESQRSEIFKQPDALNYLADLQIFINSLDVVGKSNSLSDVIKTVHRELLLGKTEEFRIPDSSNAVAQTLITYQNSHRPHDLWHFVTPDYQKTSLWIQLTSGDNQDMAVVEQKVADYITAHPMPYNLKAKWFGLTHINVVWQEKMVTGMFESFTGSFIVVLIMMVLLFRSFSWGLLSMIPLTLTVGLIYGFIGLIGKDYDMPVAVLSSLSIGLAVDYAIHFLSRAREYTTHYGSWEAAIGPLFNEPAMAISRNAIIVGVGFLPLLAAPLVPYQTVGFFIASILFLAGLTSLLLLPAIITLMPNLFFRNLNNN